MRPILILLALLSMVMVISAQDAETPVLGMYEMPDCDTLADIRPDTRIGGNVTISFGGLEFYEAYVDQPRDTPFVTIEGEQLLGGKINFEGCYVDETEFRLVGEMNGMQVLLIGIAVEPDFSEPTFGGLWFGWTGEYDPEQAPTAKGFFFQLF